eukprot:jgi/Mesvir1/11648/Mv00049-RA.1
MGWSKKSGRQSGNMGSGQGSSGQDARPDGHSDSQNVRLAPSSAPGDFNVIKSCTFFLPDDVNLDTFPEAVQTAVSAVIQQYSSVLMSPYKSRLALVTKEIENLRNEVSSLKQCEQQLKSLRSEYGGAMQQGQAEQCRLQREIGTLRDQLFSSERQVTTLRAQLSAAERQAASDPAKLGGSYSESCAIPSELGGACDSVYNAFNKVGTKVILMLWKSDQGQQLLRMWLSSSFALPAGPPAIAEKRFLKQALIGLLSQAAFTAFECESFHARGSSCLLLDRKERAAHFEQRYLSLSAAYHGESFPPAEHGPVVNWHHGFAGRLQQTMGESQELYQVVFGECKDLLEAASWSMWRLHVLAYAFEVPPEVVWRVAGDKASPACVEFEDDWGQRDASTHLVAFTVFPGFRLGKSHLLKKCRVVLQWPHELPPPQPPCGVGLPCGVAAPQPSHHQLQQQGGIEQQQAGERHDQLQGPPAAPPPPPHQHHQHHQPPGMQQQEQHHQQLPMHHHQQGQYRQTQQMPPATPPPQPPHQQQQGRQHCDGHNPHPPQPMEFEPAATHGTEAAVKTPQGPVRQQQPSWQPSQQTPQQHTQQPTQGPSLPHSQSAGQHPHWQPPGGHASSQHVAAPGTPAEDPTSAGGEVVGHRRLSADVPWDIPASMATHDVLFTVRNPSADARTLANEGARRPSSAPLAVAGSAPGESSCQDLAAMFGDLGEGVIQPQQPGWVGVGCAQAPPAAGAANNAPPQPQTAPSCTEVPAGKPHAPVVNGACNGGTAMASPTKSYLQVATKPGVSPPCSRPEVRALTPGGGQGQVIPAHKASMAAGGDVTRGRSVYPTGRYKLD